MDLKRLRLLTIVGPVAFLLLIEIVSIVLLAPLLGNATVPRLLLTFAVLVLAAIPFSFWVFSVIERQQRQVAASAALLDSVTDHAIFRLDTSGRITSWSRGAERVKGYRADEIIGEHIARLYLPEDVERDVPAQVLARAAERGQVEEEGWRLRKDGSRFWASVISAAVRDESGKLLGFTHVTRDMTERRQTDERVRALNDKLAHRVDELSAINTAIASISRALDLSSVLQSITDAARELVQARYAALGVADADGTLLQFITSGISAEQRAAIGPLPHGHGLLGALIEDVKPVRVPDITRDRRKHGFPPNHPPMTSLLGVPILFQEKPVGDLYLTDKIDQDSFSQEDQDLLTLLANHAAVAIQNARLFDEVRQARDRFQTWNLALEEKVAERTREIERSSKELTARVLQAQEAERKRIARELHDDTAQSLSTLLITMDVLEPSIPTDNAVLRSGFQRVRGLLERTLTNVRALSHDLRPTILDDFGLVAALKWYADQFTETFHVPVTVRAERPPDSALTDDMDLTLFRIVQEALMNSGKYAEATRASIRLAFDREKATLVVEDDGKGFDVNDARRPTQRGGLGLYGMRERADLIGAALTLESEQNSGTRITIVVPLPGRALTDDDRAHPGHTGRGEEATC